REVGDDVLEQREAERPPVGEGGVLDLDAMQPALSIGADPVQDGAAPALHHAEGAPPGRQRREGGARRSGWHSRERLADEADRFPELLDPNLKARLDISFFQDRNPEPQAGVGGEWVIAADVAVDAGGAGD